MPLILTVLCKLNPEVSSTVHAKIFADVDVLMQSEPIEGLMRFEQGPTIRVGKSQGWDYALHAEFDNRTAYEAFLTHPIHISVAKLFKSAIQAAPGLLVSELEVPVRDEVERSWSHKARL